MFNPAGLRPELLTIRLGLSMVAGFAIALSVGAFVSPIGWDFLPPFLGALVVAGLSVIHFYFDKREQKGKFGLVVFYLFFIIMSPYVGALVVLIALNDSVLDLRKRLIQKEG